MCHYISNNQTLDFYLVYYKKKRFKKNHRLTLNGGHEPFRDQNE